MENKMKKIDMHAHVTTRKLSNVVASNAGVEAVLGKMAEFGIEKTVLLATYFPHRSSGVSNYRLYDWVKGNPELVMFGSLDFEHYYYQGYNELDEMAGTGKVKGIKIYTCYQNIDLKGEKLKEVVKLASKNKLPVMFHTGYSYSAMSTLGRPSVSEMVKAGDLENLIAEFGDTKFVMSHLNKPFTKDLINTVNKYKNVYTDVSGLINSKYDEKERDSCVQEIKIFLAECGSQKLLFGTDFPVQTHEDSVYFVERAMGCFPIEAKEDVYYNNAMEVLKI